MERRNAADAAHRVSGQDPDLHHRPVPGSAGGAVAGVPRPRRHLSRETITQLAAWLGHSDPAFTLRTYVHFTSKSGARGMAALGSLPAFAVRAAVRTQAGGRALRRILPRFSPAPRKKPRRSLFSQVRRGEGRTSRPVRRVLSPGGLAALGEAAIHLDLPLPTGSCGLPADSGWQPSSVRAGPSWDGPILTLLRVGFT
ncbi:hypothetical protein GCM10009544_55490 [Streptomyces stramineus]|uniref:Tyr recombinase domain-containing protein n=1 Tax=Streptomyces stramineus TaxID=173861 RepID=A0ABN1AZC6_9ACTN